MGVFRWLLNYHLNYPIRFFYVIIFSVVEIFLYLYPVTLSADIIDSLMNGADFKSVQSKLIILFFFAIFQSSIFFSINFINETLAHRVTTDITYDLFTSLQFKSLAYHDGIDPGQIMARATGDTRNVNNALSPGIVRSLTLITAWIIALYVSILIHWSLVFFTIIVFLIYLYSLYRFGLSRLHLSVRVLQDFSDLTDEAIRTVSGIKEIKSFAAEELVQKNFTEIVDQHIESRIAEGEKNSWFYPALLATFYSSGIIALSVYLTFIEVITFRELIIVAGVIGFLQVISSGIQWQSRMVISAIAATSRLYELINDKDPTHVEDGNIDFDGDNSSIEFKNVSFAYKTGLPKVLKNINLLIENNKTIAVVGPPGSGKTTLTKLIQRLYEPISGEILLGGVPINNYSNESLRKNLSTVEQDIFLFNKTVLDNIKFGKPDSTDEEIVAASKIAEAHGFIVDFPEGYKTFIGEGGVRLSGGQAQRIAIARALLVNPAILLMDDAASALDARTEAKIQKAITKILRTRTTVITTHRLAIIAKADIVIIMEKGEIVGTGTHRSLIKSNQHYRRLFEKHYVLPELTKTTGGD